MSQTLPLQPGQRSQPVRRRAEMTERGWRIVTQAAMRGDVIRAIVELVTNSDDSMRGRSGGAIDILAEHIRAGEHNRIVVRDNGPGMSHEQLDDALLKPGKRTSSPDDRGFYGFGLKDCSAFGRVDVSTIRDGQLSRIVLFKSMDAEDFGARPADPVDRAVLDLTGDGTVVTVFVQRPAPVPQHKNLIDRLSRHVQLRDILGRRLIVLGDLTNTDRATQRLEYRRPAWVEQVLDEDFEVSGYAESRAHLVVYRSEERLQDERTPWRDSGIVIAGRNAVHEATYFSLEGRSGALFFTGRLDCPAIDDVQEAYEAGELSQKMDPRNTFPVVTRTRDGLDPSHPFTIAIRHDVEARLGPLVDKLERDEAHREPVVSKEMRQRLDDCARSLAEEFQRIAEAAEIDVPAASTGATAEVQPVVLEVVPPRIRLEPRATKRLTIRAWPQEWVATEPIPSPAIAHVQCDSTAIEALPSQVELLSDPLEPRRLRGAVTIASLDDDENDYVVTVTLGYERFPVVVEVAEEEPPVPEAPPSRLEFIPERHSCRVGRRRRLRLRAPDNLVLANDTLAVLRGSNLEHAETAQLTPVATESDSWHEAEVVVRVTKPGVCVLRAELGGQVATCRISATDDERRPRFRFEPIDEAPRYPEEGRARWAVVDGVQTLWILTGHPSLRRYFGASRHRQDEIECRVLLAEIIAEAVATRTQVLSDQRQAAAPQNAGYYVQGRYVLMDKYLRAAHRSLVPNAPAEA